MFHTDLVGWFGNSIGENMKLRSDQLLKSIEEDFLDALKTLEHSWSKLHNQPIPDKDLKDLDAFEPWEAMTARFARTSDIFLSKYVRLLVLREDPGFRGEMRDILDKAEKLGIVSDAYQWMKVREPRNMIAHEYTKEDISKTLNEVSDLVPFVISELRRINP